MTLSELVTQVRSQLAEPANTPDAQKFWTDVEIKAWINRGYEQFCMATKIVKDIIIKTVAEDVKEKTIETQFVQIDRIEWKDSDNNITELFPIAIEDVDFSSDADTGTPTNYYLRSRNVIGLDPTPDTEGTLRIFCSYIPSTLTDEVPNPVIPSMFQDALVEFALWKARLKYPEDRKLQLFIEHKTNFRDLVVAAIKQNSTLKKKTTGIKPRLS